MRVAHDRILVVDIDPVIRSGIASFLTDQGLAVAEASDLRQGQLQLARFRPNVVVLGLPNSEVSSFLLQARSTQPKLPVLLLAGQTSQTGAPPRGADEVLTKPVEMPEVHAALSRLLRGTPRGQAIGPAPGRTQSGAANPFLGRSPAIARLREMSRRIALSESPVLIQGETGAGKGVLAKWLHQNSPRAHCPFLDLNCAGLPRELLESELFGHQRGAFTSATSLKQGLLEVADGGTVFLDEIGDMDLQVQSKLLKVLEDRVFRRLGDIRDRAVDMRLISATHCELQDLVREHKFRSDLYYRVNIVWLRVPPLRQRIEDIVPLSEHLLNNIGRHWGREHVRISASAMRALESHGWPGNIRELRNVLERAFLLAGSDELRAEHLEFQSVSGAAGFAVDRSHGTLKQMERAYISYVLADERGSVERAARRLGIPRSSLYNKMRRFEIPQGTGRSAPELSGSRQPK